jgi:type I restriction enzyme R subunit
MVRLVTHKKTLNEPKICQNFITPAIVGAGCGKHTQVRREYSFTAGRVIVRGKLAVRGKQKRADYLLFHQSNLPLAVVEAKDNNHPVGGGMQQALAYADTLDVPLVFSSNGDAFLFHDRPGLPTPVERQIGLDEFPSPDELWNRYCAWKGLTEDADSARSSPHAAVTSPRLLSLAGTCFSRTGSSTTCGTAGIWTAEHE